MMAAGKVTTGFSMPFVALYNEAGGTVTYSEGRQLARGVSVSIEPETGDDNTFYADNVAAEEAQGTFTGGTVTLTVDGLFAETEAMIYGLPAPEKITVGENTVDVYDYGDEINIPYVGIGVVVRQQSAGVVTYAPVVLTKARFKTPGTEAATQEENIEWQTQELTASLFRDDSEKHRWKRIGADQASEAAAVAVIKALLNITETPAATAEQEE